MLLSRTSIRIIAAVILTLLYCSPAEFRGKLRRSQFDERGAEIQLSVLGNWSAYEINGFEEYLFTIYSEMFKFAFIHICEIEGFKNLYLYF